jgi:SAM-dependent MidA family methyltransferase
MELALHEPGLGYYASGARKFGAAGDFVTAPELGDLFGRTLARQLAEIPGQRVLEIGAGSGALAETLIKTLDCEYWILETSGELRERQKKRLGNKAIHLEKLPGNFEGAIIANEVADAMPVHVVHWTAEGIFERGVAKEFAWQDRPATEDLLQKAKSLDPAPPYISEINLLLEPWIASLADGLARGAIFVIDYGFPRHEYYHPQRAAGTLMCHHRHHAHPDPFAHPGEEDITAHVDFSAAAAAGRTAGAQVLGYATQAQFLVNCGITDVLGEANVENALHYAPIAAQAQKLLSPAEMGELFKVLALGKGIDAPLLGFSRGDKQGSL